MTARRGVFDEFIEAEEDADLEFAMDHEGRQAIAKLELATARAEEVIRRFTRPKAPPDGAAIPPWARESAPAGAAEPGAEGSEDQVLVRHWTDPDRRGTVVSMRGGRPRPVSVPRPRRFGRAVLGRRLLPGGPRGRSIAAGAVPRRRLRG
jgi:hypothetical protein